MPSLMLVSAAAMASAAQARQKSSGSAEMRQLGLATADLGGNLLPCSDHHRRRIASREERIERQQAELAAAVQATSRARAELGRVERAVARKQAQLLVLEDALVANEELLGRLGRASYQYACPRDRTGLTTRELNLCELLGLNANSYADFIGRYTSAAGRRGKADEDNDFAPVREAYERLLPLAREARVQNAWLARVHEGIAYADYRLRDLDDAQRRIEQAARLDANSAFVALTGLKIACTRQVPREEIRRRYFRQLQRLRAVIANSPAGTPRRYAELELRYFVQDRELTMACAYAGLPAGSTG